MAPTYRQDMPPQGGYQSINWERIPAKKLFSGVSLFAGFAAVTTVSLYIYSLSFRKMSLLEEIQAVAELQRSDQAWSSQKLVCRCAKLGLFDLPRFSYTTANFTAKVCSHWRLELEVNDAKIAIEPILLAERDREFLKQLRRNRNEEAKLMKDVAGWKTGTYYGEPIYKTLKKEEWFDPIIEEYYAHSHPKKQEYRQLLSLRQ